MPLPASSAQQAVEQGTGAKASKRARPRRFVRPCKACPAVPRRHSLLLRLLKQLLGECLCKIMRI